MKLSRYAFILLCCTTLAIGCKRDDSFLDKKPNDVLFYEQVWGDRNLILSVIADLYVRLPDFQHIDAWAEYASFDEGFASSGGDYGRHQNQDYNYDAWSYWDYGYIREINLFLQKGEEADTTLTFSNADKQRFMAEARFMRAMAYFELVKRMGGVPLILEPLTYDYSGDASSLRFPRSKEHEIYDFVIAEMDTIKNILPNNADDRSRASRGAALALQTRAAVYAGSIAKHGATTPSVSTAGGEVGIPLTMANAYYTKALQAAQELIGTNVYQLYEAIPANLSQNFASIFLDKSSSNREAIFVRDSKLRSGRVTGFTVSNQPRSFSEENDGNRLNPSLNLMQSFELLDNTFAPFQTNETGGGYVYYDNIQDIFAGRDARLAGTAIIPGGQFKNKTVDIWAGYMLQDGSIITGDIRGGQRVLPGKTDPEQVVGFDGPINGVEQTAQTGFLIRKYLDETPGSGLIGTGSEVWWIRFRFSEVLLNAAEAAFELNQPDVAAGYMNQVRRRAGFQTDLTAAQITFDRVVHERKVELAFEGHQLFDMRRWRLAHIIWNGSATALTTNPGGAREVSTRVYGLWPYRVYAPGNANNGKYVFRTVIPTPVTQAHRFRLGNYYSQISDAIRTGNPLLVPQPNQ